MAEECSGRRTIAFSRSVARSFAREQARQKMEMRRRERSQEAGGAVQRNGRCAGRDDVDPRARIGGDDLSGGQTVHFGASL
jgi:hypothetical protein